MTASWELFLHFRVCVCVCVCVRREFTAFCLDTSVTVKSKDYGINKFLIFIYGFNLNEHVFGDEK